MDNMLGDVCPRWRTTDKLDHLIMEDANKKFFVGGRFELELLSTIREIVHVVRNNYSLELFIKVSA